MFGLYVGHLLQGRLPEGGGRQILPEPLARLPQSALVSFSPGDLGTALLQSQRQAKRQEQRTENGTRREPKSFARDVATRTNVSEQLCDDA